MNGGMMRGRQRWVWLGLFAVAGVLSVACSSESDPSVRAGDRGAGVMGGAGGLPQIIGVGNAGSAGLAVDCSAAAPADCAATGPRCLVIKGRRFTDCGLGEYELVGCHSVDEGCTAAATFVYDSNNQLWGFDNGCTPRGWRASTLEAAQQTCAGAAGAAD